MSDLSGRIERWPPGERRDEVTRRRAAERHGADRRGSREQRRERGREGERGLAEVERETLEEDDLGADEAQADRKRDAGARGYERAGRESRAAVERQEHATGCER